MKKKNQEKLPVRLMPTVNAKQKTPFQTIQKWLGKMIPQNLHREMFKEENEQLSSTMGCL